MPHDIIDNQTTYLGDAVRPLLNQSDCDHFAAGEFFLSSFKAIAAELEKVSELRLLIGNTSNRATIEQLAEGRRQIPRQRINDRMRRILESKREARKRLAALPFADKVKLLEQLRDRALAINKSPLKRQMSRRN